MVWSWPWHSNSRAASAASTSTSSAGQKLGPSLVSAVRRSDAAEVHRLVVAGAPVGPLRRAVKGDTGDPLIFLAETGEVAEVLANAGPEFVDAFISDAKNGPTALMSAIIRRKIDVIRVLLDHGANLETPNAQGLSAVEKAKRIRDGLVKRNQTLNGCVIPASEMNKIEGIAKLLQDEENRRDTEVREALSDARLAFVAHTLYTNRLRAKADCEDLTAQDLADMGVDESACHAVLAAVCTEAPLATEVGVALQEADLAQWAPALFAGRLTQLEQCAQLSHDELQKLGIDVFTHRKKLIEIFSAQRAPVATVAVAAKTWAAAGAAAGAEAWAVEEMGAGTGAGAGAAGAGAERASVKLRLGVSANAMGKVSASLCDDAGQWKCFCQDVANQLGVKERDGVVNVAVNVILDANDRRGLTEPRCQEIIDVLNNDGLAKY